MSLDAGGLPHRVTAEPYVRGGATWWSLAERLVFQYLVRPLAAELAGISGRILDVASGTGALARLLPGAVALDLVPGQLAGNPARHRVVGDAVKLPFLDNSFAAAACAFGISHVDPPVRALEEMARIAPTVGVLTWGWPKRVHEPRAVIAQIVEREVPASERSALMDRLEQQVGSPEAVARLFGAAGLRAQARVVEVDVPWPGTDAWVDLRLATHQAESGVELLHLRDEARAAVDALPPDRLPLRPWLVLAVGSRDTRRGVV